MPIDRLLFILYDRIIAPPSPKSLKCLLGSNVSCQPPHGATNPFRVSSKPRVLLSCHRSFVGLLCRLARMRRAAALLPVVWSPVFSYYFFLFFFLCSANVTPAPTDSMKLSSGIQSALTSVNRVQRFHSGKSQPIDGDTWK